MRTLLTGLVVACVACGGGETPDATPGEPAAQAEAPPGTDIWTAALNRADDGTLSLGEATNATDREGYDNQPFFVPDGSGFWYTVIDDAGVADIWFHDLASGANTAVTTTAPESEYSATPAPDGGFTAIRVEADSTQRLWHFDTDGQNGRVLFPELAPVGYHAWPDDETVVMFVLGSPATLQVGNAATGMVETLTENIGRSMHRIPESTDASFVQRVSQEESWITRLDPSTGEQTRLIEAMEGGDFHTWTPDGVLLMGNGSSLYAWRPGSEGDWEEIGSLPAGTISRLAVSPDGGTIALVVEAG